MVLAKKFKWFIFLNFVVALTFRSGSEGFNVKNYSKDHISGIVTGGPVIIVSTVDGKITALDKIKGTVAWSFDDGNGPLLSSSLSKFHLSQGGKTVWLIPSLKGQIFKFDGNSVESLPVNADQLLSSSFKFSDGSILVGDNEIATYGINSSTGRLAYYCTSTGCSTLEEPQAEDHIIILRRNQKTVRSLDNRNGHEKWSFSVGEFSIWISSGNSKDSSSVGTNADNVNQVKNVYDNSVRPETTDKIDAKLTRDHTQDENGHSYSTGRESIQLSVPEGTISLHSDNGQKWHYKFKSPIANVWHADEDKHQKLDLFHPSTVPALKGNGNILKTEPTIYLGFYEKAAYIQVSNILNKPSDMGHAIINHLTSYTIKFSFRPYLANADHLTEAIMPNMKGGDITVYGSSATTQNCKESWAAYIDGSDKLFNEGGFYLKSNLPYFALADQSERKGKVTEIDVGDEDYRMSSSSTTFLYAASWWKENLLFGSIASTIVVVIVHMVFSIFTKHFKSSKSDTSCVSSVMDNEKLNRQTESTYVSRFLDDFEVKRCLGKGGFGIVLESQNKVDDCSYAIKRICLPNKATAREKVLREVRALAKLNHQGIVRYYNAWIEEPPTGWQKKVDKELMNNISSSTDVFSMSQATLQESDMKSRHQKGSACLVDRNSTTHSLHQRNVMFESTEPFTFPSHSNAAIGQINDVFDCSDIAREEDNLSVASDDSTYDQPLPFKRYGGEGSISIAFENSEVGLSTGSQDSAIENDSYRTKCSTKDRQKCQNSSKLSTNERLRKYGSKAEAPQQSTVKLENVYLYIQMELCQKENLHTWLASGKERRDVYCLWIMKQVLSAVEYIHNRNLIHRDLKPSNIFFSHDGTIKVGDFGLVTEREEFSSENCNEIKSNSSSHNRNESHTEHVGTGLYMAPEQMNSRRYSQKVDIFPIGLILIELFTTFSTQMERIHILREARNGQIVERFRLKYPEESHLTKRMLSYKPSARPSASEARQSQVFSKYR